ncbi:MAG: acyl carrier protein [Deltaproteobacteria bacterium]|nr:acyl carrier protein [Deltaproteobacteria bacterium]MBW2099183.1 acyl carrier protein [Deltaproteobacteria bacterium]
MDILKKTKEILAEILDIDEEEIAPETYLIRDMNAESIDLLELAVALNSAFNIKINDDEIFLRNLRPYLTEAKEKQADEVAYLLENFPFLTKDRMTQILDDLQGGPVLKVKDLAGYVAWREETS